MEPSAVSDWQRWNPRAEDLELETVGEQETNGVKVTRLYFTAHKIAGQPVRIYGVYARPARVGRRLPGLLFIHGGGQVADEPEAVAMARHGYAVFSHDWKCAEQPDQPNHASRWPFDAQGRRLRADEYRDSPAWIARRALTVLERQPEVDPRRLGVYGFSWGGYHTWTVAATDDRVKAANPSCGVLWSRQPFMNRLRVPVLFTSASNDFFAKLDAAHAVLEGLNVPCLRLIAPNEDHNLAGTPWETTRLRWFNHHLRGGPPLAAAPRIDVTLDGASGSVTVRAPGATSSQLVYSYGSNAAPDRCWFGAPLTRVGRGVFQAALPRVAGLELWCFANCAYRDGTALSTDLVTLPAPAGMPPAPGRVLYDPAADGCYPWYFSWQGPVPDHPWHSWGDTALAVAADVGGRPALRVHSSLPVLQGQSVFKAFLRSPACPLRRRADAQGLSIEVFGARPLRVTVAAHASGVWHADAQPFRAVLEVAADEGWATLVLPMPAFQRQNQTNGQTETLSSFAAVQQFHVTLESADRAGARPALGTIRWLP